MSPRPIRWGTALGVLALLLIVFLVMAVPQLWSRLAP